MESYRKSPTLFRTVPSQTPYSLPFHKIGVHNPTPKLRSLLSQERLKLRTANLDDTFTGSLRTQADEKFWRKGSVGVSRDCPNFFEYPLLSQEATNFKLGRYIHRVHANKSPLKFGRTGSVGKSRDSPNFGSTPYYLRNG